jgi:hypothetical protein
MAEKKSKLVEIKQKPTAASVRDFINAVPALNKNVKRQFCAFGNDVKSNRGRTCIMEQLHHRFGIKRYKSPATGREVDWLRIGFLSP